MGLNASHGSPGSPRYEISLTKISQITWYKWKSEDLGKVKGGQGRNGKTAGFFMRYGQMRMYLGRWKADIFF